MSKIDTRRVFLVNAGVLLVGSSALAQYSIPQFSDVPGMISSFVVTNQIVQQANERLFNDDTPSIESSPSSRSTNSTSAARRPAETSLTFSPSRGASATPARMAEAYPPERRAEATRLFTELLRGFEAVEVRFGLRKRDITSAMAAFIAGSWSAYHNTAFPDESFVPLVQQLRSAIPQDAPIGDMSDESKRTMYEELVILGMFSATTQLALKTAPDARREASMRQAGRTYLEAFLKVPADSVVISPQGLSL
jgi:hypothetical protein